MKRWWLIIAIIVNLELGGGLAVYLTRPLALPAGIRRQAGFTLLVPKTNTVKLDRSTVTYDPSVRLVTYRAQALGGHLTVNQQPAPVDFLATPAKYEELKRSLNQYQTLETSLGTVSLARPKDISGRQVALLNTVGTLIFIYPDFELGTQQWTNLFAALALHR